MGAVAQRCRSVKDTMLSAVQRCAAAASSACRSSTGSLHGPTAPHLSLWPPQSAARRSGGP
jgi:hypothetical protein